MMYQMMSQPYEARRKRNPKEIEGLTPADIVVWHGVITMRLLEREKQFISVLPETMSIQKNKEQHRKKRL